MLPARKLDRQPRTWAKPRRPPRARMPFARENRKPSWSVALLLHLLLIFLVITAQETLHTGVVLETPQGSGGKGPAGGGGGGHREHVQFIQVAKTQPPITVKPAI